MSGSIWIAIENHIDPDILLIDEILAVGDTNFQRKCLDKMREFHEKGATIILITHSLDLVKSFCQRAILLWSGKIIYAGLPDKAIKKYAQI